MVLELCAYLCSRGIVQGCIAVVALDPSMAPPDRRRGHRRFSALRLFRSGLVATLWPWPPAGWLLDRERPPDGLLPVALNFEAIRFRPRLLLACSHLAILAGSVGGAGG